MTGRQSPPAQQVSLSEIEEILDKVAPVLDDTEMQKLRALVETLSYLEQELGQKKVDLARLVREIFGPKTETAKKILGDACAAGDSATDGQGCEKEADRKKRKAKGHGRNGSDAYTGARRVDVPLQGVGRGDPCPECPKGKMYPILPKVLLRITGQAPVFATAYELQGLRCNLCGETVRASQPPDIGEKKYDPSVLAMIGLLKYGSGFPFNRLEGLQESLGIPLPSSTQWQLVAGGAKLLEPVLDELIRVAAQGEILHNDDTTMKILELMEENAVIKAEGLKGQRTGMFTSGIVAFSDGHRIGLFFTGRQHAGENLGDILQHREAERGPPIQMCDGSSCNPPKGIATILANCLTHGRRYFVDLVESFPTECRHLIEELGEVYHNDAIARRDEMSPLDRLSYHQVNSGPVMDRIRSWMDEQITERRIEPNSALGRALSYMTRRWSELTLFLREPGAPLDNSICERALKRTVLHRKNALFYKTENGARVGDTFMSLIYSAELASANPFEYLVAILQHHRTAAANPALWMPWNYRDALQDLCQAT